MVTPKQTECRRLEFGITGFYPAFTGARNARTSEEMGFDIHGFSENHSRVPDPFGEMRDAIRETTRIKLACGPVNFLTRNPGVIAVSHPAHPGPQQWTSHLRYSQRRFGGRGCGPGASKDRRHGATTSALLRTYLHRGEVAVRRPHEPDRMGRRNLLRPPTHPDGVQRPAGDRPGRPPGRPDMPGCRHQPREGGVGPGHNRPCPRDSGRSRGDLGVGLFAPLALTGDRPSGRALIRTRVSSWAHMQSGKGTDLTQQPEILRRVTSALRGSYDYRYHHPGAPPDNPNSALCDEEFGDWMGIGGPPSFAVDRLGQLVDMGVDFFMTALPMPEREVFAAEVMPALRSARR